MFLMSIIAPTIASPINEAPSSAVKRHKKAMRTVASTSLNPDIQEPGRSSLAVTGHRRQRSRSKVKYNQLQQYKLCLDRQIWDENLKRHVRILELNGQLVDVDPNESWTMLFLPVVEEEANQDDRYLAYRTGISEVPTDNMGPLHKWGLKNYYERINAGDYPHLLQLGTVTMTPQFKRNTMTDVNEAITEHRIDELPTLLFLFHYQILFKGELDDRALDPVHSSEIRDVAFDLSRYQVLHRSMLEKMGTAAGSIVLETMLWEWYLYSSILDGQLDFVQSLNDKNRDILLHMDYLYDPSFWPSASSSNNPETGLSHRT
ncbi:hypothetical protein EV360DRAFT_77762 [Lentinula raphanica]|nr:hypothetical protein EV360DRAFT_77762 [Lentinula raphanica]